MTTINKAKIRRDIATKLCQMFLDSGVEYGCRAAVYGVIRDSANIEAQKLVLSGVIITKTSYAFNLIPLTRDILISDATKLVHLRFYP